MLKPVEEMTEDEIRAELSSGSENGGAEVREEATHAPRDVSEMSEDEVRAELAALDGGEPAAEPEEPAEPGEPPSARKFVAPAKRIVRRDVAGLESPEDYRQLGGMSTGEYVAKKLKAQGVEPYDVGPETGTLEGMGKTILNIAPAALGKPVNSFVNMRQQQLARGFTDDGRRIEDMTEDEQDYLADEAMMNGWAGAARTFLGNIFGNAPKGLEPKRGADGKVTLEGAMSMLEPGDTPYVGKRAVRWMLSGVKGDSPLAKWDEEQGIRYRDPVERRAARAAYLKELAGGMVEAHEVGKHNARAELKGRGADDDVDILGETVIQGGYSLPFIAGAVAGGGAGAVLLPAAASATGRYAEKKSDEYDFDDDGNMYVRTERDKSDVRAFTEAAAGGLAEAAVEKWGGEGVTKLLKASVGRSKLVKAVGGKLMATEVGKSVSAFLRRYHALTATTGVNSLPEEIIEEFEQDIIDKGLGLDLKPEERDAKGMGTRTWDATKDFWKPENLWKLTESMIGMMAVQGGAAHAMDRLGSRRVDAVLEQGLGLDADTVRSFTATEKRQAFAAWLNNMSDEEVAHTFDEGTKYITACLSEIRKQAKHDFGAAEAEGMKFTVPTRKGADGAEEANWKPGTDGSGRSFETLDDFRTGVGIERYEAAPGKFVYRVHDKAGHRTSTEDENEALRMADALVGRNAVREAKVEYLQGLQERMFPGANVFLADSLKDAMDGIRGEYGQEAVDSLMGSDEYGRGTDFGQSFHFRDRTGKDNIVFILDRIENAKDALDAANHEAGGHSGINLALKDKRAFLEKMDSRGLDRDDRELFDKLVVRLQEEYGLKNREDVFKDPNAAEELFAYLTEETMWGPTLKQQFSHAVREAFRGKLKIDLKMNGADIYAVAARGRKELRKGKGGKTIRTGGAEGTEGADRTDEAIRKVQTAATVAPNGLAESEETNDFGDEAAAFGEESPSPAPSPEAKPAAKPAPAPAPAENPAGTGTRQDAPGASVRAPSEGGTTSRPEPTASGKGPSAPQIGDAGAESGVEGAETTAEKPKNAHEAGQNGTPEESSVTEVHARVTPKSATHNFGRIRKRFTEALRKLTTAYNRGRHKGEYDEAQKELDAAMEDLFLSPSSKWAFKVDGANGEKVTFNLDARIDRKTMRLNRVQVEGLVQRIAPNVSAKAAKVIAKRLCDRLDPMVAAHVAAKRAAKTNLTDTPEGLAKRRRLADENFRGAKRLRAYCEANPESMLARWYGWFGEASPKMFAEAFSQDAVVDADLGIGDAYAKEGWDVRLEEWAGADGGFKQYGDGSYDFTGVYERLVREYGEAIADNRTAEQRAADDARAEEERAEFAEEEARAAEESAYDFAGSAEAREDYERQLASSAITDERGEPVATLRDVPDGAAFSVGGEEFWMERHEPDGSIVVEEFRDFDDIRQYRLKPTATGVEVERVGNGNESAEDGNAGERSGNADAENGNAGGRNGNAAVRTAEEARGAGVRDREDSEARRGAEGGPEGRGGREGAGAGEAAREAAAAVGAEGGAAPRGENTVREAFSKEGVRWRKRTLPPPKKTGIGYKVFVQKDGKLYPPMVNPSGEATPIGEWLDAEAGALAEPSKTGRQRVQAGGKGTNVSKQTLAYRPGWHLGKIPYALQFNKGEKVPNPQGVRGKNGEVIKVGRLFPANFVWAEVEYAMDVDYQDEAMSYGMKNGKFNHALAGLPRIPENGSYEYRTNANPATDPWIITGAMKVTRVLSNAEVDELVRNAGREPQERENPESNEFKPNWRIGGLYTGSAADYDNPSLNAVGSGSGLSIHGHALYATDSRDSAERYARGVVGQKVSEGKLPENASKYVYEQTWFMNRKDGEEPHLLKWNENIDRENFGRIVAQAEKENVDISNIIAAVKDGKTSFATSRAVYNSLSRILRSKKKASEFLARADIDGIEYDSTPINGKSVKNYASFRDDNIRVDHKWVDGELMFRRSDLPPRSNSRITPAEDAAYMDAVKRGDMETAARMVREAAAKAMPDTKVVDEDGLPLVVYHGTRRRFTRFARNSHFGGNIEQALDRLGFYHDQEDFDEADTSALEKRAKDNGGIIVRGFLDIRNPLVLDVDFGSWEDSEFKKRGLSLDEHDGVIYDNWHEGVDGEVNPAYITFNSSQIKSADPVTYDDAGNVIPLSQRFSESPDIRFRRSNFIQNADAVEVSRRLGASPAELALLAEAPIKLFDMGREDRLNAASFTKNATELELVRSGGRVFSRTGFRAVTDVIREWAQDYNIRLRRLEERLGVGKDESAYYAADRSYGRVEQLWGQYQVNRVRPLMEALKRAGCTTPEDFADFGMYLVAKHGEEYNAMLAQRSRWVAEALDNPTARAVVDTVLAGTRDLDDAAMADVKAAMGWNDEQLDLFRRGLTGSSQSTAFWKRMLADNYDATGKTARFADAERIVRDMTEDFRRLLVDSGRLSPAQADTWRRLSPNYVPMMHDEEGEFDVWQKFFWGSDVADAPKRSKAYGNSEVKHAFGRETMPENPVYFIVQQYQSAVLRSADNEVRRTLANLVRKYEAKHAADPNAPRLGVVFRYMGEDEFKDAQKRIGVLQAAVAGGTATAAQVAELARLNQAVAEARNAPGNIPTTKAVGSNGLVYEIPEVASVEQKNPEIVAFKEDGDLKFVRLGVASSQVDVDNGWLATSDARSIGAALKKQTLVTSGITDALRKVTGWYSAMRTAYSPTFMLSNFMADNTQAARNLYATFGVGAVAKFEHFAFHGFGAAKAVLNDRYGTTLIQQYAKEWADNGGRIGGMATENVADIRKKFDRQLRLMDSSFRSLAQCRTAKDVIRLLGDKRCRLREFVEHANAIVEMGTRIAAYATHREMTRGNGKTDAENIADAISYSRDVTVNFNRKGRLTPVINALFAFSNASVQDFERSLRAFGDGRYASGAAGVARIGLRTGLRMGAGLFVLGFLSSWLGYAQDDDEDEKKGIPQWGNAKEYVKQSQITVRFGQRTFHIPIRGLSNLPYYMGHKAFELMRGKTSAGRAAWQTAQTAFGDVIDVIGGAPTFAQAATPSVLRPGMELVQNRSFTGSQLYREPQFGKTDVLSQMGRDSTHEIWKGLARALNEVGTLGHGRQRTSWLDFQPEKLQQVWNWLGGSVGRDVGQAAGTLWDILHGEVPDVRNAFAVSRFVGKVDENSAKFYEARDEWQSAVDELKRIDPADEAAVAEFVREHPFLAPQNRRVADELTDLAAISKKLLTTEMRSASDEERKTAHEMRLRAQWLFMDQYRSNERMDREERSDMRLMERFAKRTGAAERREKRRGKRELRGTMRKIPLLGE